MVGHPENRFSQDTFHNMLYFFVCFSHSYIASDAKYRAVLVDSEPKVIQRVVKGLSFRYCNCFAYCSQKDANGVANSEDPDQTAPLEEQSDLGLHCLPTYLSEYVGSLR